MKPFFVFALILLSAVPFARAQEASQPQAAATTSVPATKSTTATAAPTAASTTAPATTGRVMYRNFILGVRKADVLQYETAVFYKDEGNSLYYLYQPDYFRRILRYDFENDRLVGISHEVFEFSLPNSRRIIEMAQDEEKWLTEQYGEPTASEFFWKNKMYEKHPEYWGRAVYMQDLKIRITWELADAVIVWNLYHDNMFYHMEYTIKKRAAAEDTNKIDLGAPAQTSSPAPAPQP